MRATQVIDHFRLNGFKSSMYDMFHLRRKARIIEKDLHGVIFDNETLIKNNMTFTEITMADTFQKEGRFKYPNRRLKAICYMKKGYTGHCLIKDNLIVGDIWYFGRKDADKCELHPDIELLGIKWDSAFAYSFDTFLDPDNRGNTVAKALLNNSLHDMAIKGLKKVYGYYWSDNLPAIWNARVLNKFREIGDITISRYLLFRISHKRSTCNGKN